MLLPSTFGAFSTTATSARPMDKDLEDIIDFSSEETTTVDENPEDKE